MITTITGIEKTTHRNKGLFAIKSANNIISVSKTKSKQFAKRKKRISFLKKSITIDIDINSHKATIIIIKTFL